MEDEAISPFGEIRSALDLLHQHVVKVDNIVKSTGTLPVMQSLIKNTVKTQMAGSFDMVRSELAEVVKTADSMAQALPLWMAPKPARVVTPPPVEPTETLEPASEDLFSTSLAPVPGAGPINLDEPTEVAPIPTTVTPKPTPVAEVVEEPHDTGRNNGVC